VTVDDELARSRRGLERVSPAEAAAAAESGALLVDIRPLAQRTADGEIPGAIVLERNVLEWRLDPASAHRLAQITDHDREIIVMCSEGYASSLVAATLVELGYTSAGDLEGGFQAWAKAGLPVRAGRRRPRLRAAS
jgi:rhodanese-related sulfurtransferase